MSDLPIEAMRAITGADEISVRPGISAHHRCQVRFRWHSAIGETFNYDAAIDAFALEQGGERIALHVAHEAEHEYKEHLVKAERATAKAIHADGGRVQAVGPNGRFIVRQKDLIEDNFSEMVRPFENMAREVTKAKDAITDFADHLLGKWDANEAEADEHGNVSELRDLSGNQNHVSQRNRLNLPFVDPCSATGDHVEGPVSYGVTRPIPGGVYHGPERSCFAGTGQDTVDFDYASVESKRGEKADWPVEITKAYGYEVTTSAEIALAA